MRTVTAPQRRFVLGWKMMVNVDTVACKLKFSQITIVFPDAGVAPVGSVLVKPPSFNGRDAEYQDFRFIFRIHTSPVSSVSHELMDRRGIERNPISLAAVRSLGEATLEVLHEDVLCTGLDNGTAVYES